MRNHFGGAQARVIGDADRGAIFCARRGADEAGDLLGRQHSAQLLGAARQRDHVGRVAPAHRHLVEESERRNRAIDAAGIKPGLNEMELIGAHLLVPQQIR